MARSPTLGFIGLGHIGGSVCANLLADGHAVTVVDTDESKVAPMVAAGGKRAASPAEVGADITFLSLPTPAVMEAVAMEWLTGADRPGKLLVDLTTNSPATVRSVGRRLAADDARLVEAPLTGGAAGARSRQLFFIIGGDAEDVAKVTPILSTIGRGSCHLGPLGCGNVGKLVNSLMAFTTQAAALEGLALGARHGIDLRTLVDMIRTTGGSTSYFNRRVEEIRTHGAPTEFSMELAAKDAGLMVEVGRDVAVPMPVASAVHQLLVLAKAVGLGDHDISDLAEVVERVTDLRFELSPEKDEG